MTFTQILQKYKEASFSKRDQGDRFERLMQGYLKTDPFYADRFQKVWLWNEFPYRDQLGGKDIGIDLVAKQKSGEYWAIQCKFYDESHYISKKDIDTFLSTSGRTFRDESDQEQSFSQKLFISTTDRWSSNADQTLKNQSPPVIRLNLQGLKDSIVSWDKLDQGLTGELARDTQRQLKKHQQDALNATHEHFKQANRGKLIMACGTGKTFTSLSIAEHETNGRGLVLFLVPSIALLGQTLREWFAFAQEPIKPICICSDAQITKDKKQNEDTDTTSVVDLALPASTNIDNIVRQFRKHHQDQTKGMTVVFSTYQSIDVIAQAQKHIDKDIQSEFDLIICDEAHRTTGVSLTKDEESAFTKVHDNNIIKGKKRLYMTATPRLYSDDSKSKAAQNDALICSMDDEQFYGQEIYRIGFGEAVEKDLLTDYKVLILTLSDKDVPTSLQNALSQDSQISTDDISKLIGCINGLSKQIIGDEELLKTSDPSPMRRAVAFCQNIAVSKNITNSFNDLSDSYVDTLESDKKEQIVSVESKHIDGSMSAPTRDELLGWLKDDTTEPNECRVLTNVRCLSEGVDVPSLDAVLFLSARNSQVDVVQSVGRVMRKAPNKNYGYIIIPVIVPSDVEASKALDDNDRYKVVWSVLNALRAHDDRFNATINQIELNKKKPNNILIGGIDNGSEEGESNSQEKTNEKTNEKLRQSIMQFDELQSAIFAKMVLKVGDRVYWEKWAKDVAVIAQRQIERINHLINANDTHKEAFEKFLQGLQSNINPSITKDQAIEMLSQHIITKPIFESLFDNYSFVTNNPVSGAMQNILDILESEQNDKDFETLEKFYESVKKRVEGIDNAEGKQKIIVELYDKFFKTAFPKMVEQLGIVYTPVEVVDFIIHSVNDILQKEFDRSISDENVHILDPFTGTGTFITRLIQSGLISKERLLYKYQNELHANEIVLLAYYIATVNIENALHDQIDSKDYYPFEGIVLTDTFQLSEEDKSKTRLNDGEMFQKNSARAQKQKNAPIKVIIGNPPYASGQKSENDNTEKMSYEKLDKSISKTYVANSTANLKNHLYNSYVKAFRWSTDRIGDNGGIVSFITNSGYIRKKSFDGFRKTLEKDFSKIYILDLKGAKRGKSGELAKKEGDNVFDILTGVAISILVKKDNNNSPFEVNYYEVDNYLKKSEKLNLLKHFTYNAINLVKWKKIKADEFGDWLEKRNSIFDDYHSIGDKKGNKEVFFNPNYSNGLKTQRDAWCYNFSIINLEQNMSRMISFYNKEIDRYIEEKPQNVKNFIESDETKINWTNNLIKDLEKGKKHQLLSSKIRETIYRPFTKQKLYFSRDFNERVLQHPKLFPQKATHNALICISTDLRKDFSVLLCDKIPDLGFVASSQCFPLYYFEKNENKQKSLFDTIEESEEEYIRKDGVSDFILQRAKNLYGKSVTKEDIFYYVYGLLHSPDYRETFANDLKKMLPRLPLLESISDFWAFSKAGRALANLHINYESIEPCSEVIVTGDESEFYRVEKLRFPKKDQKHTIIYNSKITLSNIPQKAYDYIVNGKSAIEWIMDRYQIKTDKKSGIKNDPNDWSDEVNNPRYILDLLLSVINVSVQTVDIVESLPKIEFGKK